ncbi:MAG: alginate lyase family protein [Bacteroidota bacterium]
MKTLAFFTTILSLTLLRSVDSTDLNVSYSMTIKDVVQTYPGKVSDLMSVLDLGQMELPVNGTVTEERQLIVLSEAVIDYFEGRPFYTTGKERKVNLSDARAIADFKFKKYKGKYKSASPDSIGQINWMYKGPLGDKEWAYSINRHAFLKDLVSAYRTTGDTLYINRFNYIMQHWIVENEPISKKSDLLSWRVLECGLRMAEVWPYIFFANKDTSEYSRGTKLLMLMSIVEHYEKLSTSYCKDNNHTLMEMTGLASIGKHWEEFLFSKHCYELSHEVMLNQLDAQVLPDGAHNELTSDYHLVALTYFEKYAQFLSKDDATLFVEKLHKMYEYLIYTMSPHGFSLNNNDSDRSYNRVRLKKYAGKTKDDELRYITTGGQRGRQPKSTSVVFPYAGQAILRDHYQADGQWLYFDVGPYGNGHQHNDKLHVSITLGDKDFLVDAGRYSYKADKWRQYFKGSYSHNVMLVDGNGQHHNEKIASQPFTDYQLGEFVDIVRSRFAAGFKNTDDKVVHYRKILYKKGEFWVVQDSIVSSKPQQYDFLWHFHPDRQLKSDKLLMYTQEAGQNLAIFPMSLTGNTRRSSAKIMKGQVDENMQQKMNAWSTLALEDFGVQGWYSKDYYQKKPSPTAVYRVEGNNVVIQWLIFPYIESLTGRSLKDQSKSISALLDSVGF